ncbi:hydantoinase/oxoprolinase family protein [Pseudodesulfovibrio sediminis]|uniref:N-methylhydantoinase A n=1 Tax=Pseudodesulfovibrio sediminis TaxID=2810563 RepID=A0ABN6EY90_9BACT|nr:hydantoinase/oxoprolinase family protein [Pseudodesulfovibrio sediminis]BCS89996.1 N-methylhydantoinase A [Pseudodesulfovibrio sediminis]
MITIGVDTGGTFTDFTYVTGETTGTYKTLSTPHNPAEAVINGLKHIVQTLGLDDRIQDLGMSIVHGSTVATNAILERKGVRTALVTNTGFTDIIEIGRQNRSRLYDLAYRRQPHIIPEALRFGILGRVSSEGDIIEDFEAEATRAVIRRIQDSGAESVAVCLLFSFLDPSHERQIGDMLTALDLPASLSSDILAEFREFERTSTTVINAYVSPIMTRYLTSLNQAVSGNSLRVMQSNGGSISAATAMRESVRTILSGPAGGAVGALELGKMAGFDKIITFDMGGTSSDVSLMDQVLPLTTTSAISGYPVKVPMIDIHTVGAGGGSIAALDPGGSLTVGPESAGATPGPICYAQGGDQVTVTDANLYLGRIVPEHFLGGGMELAETQTRTAIEALADQLDMSPVELAEGILAVANANMERAIRIISVEKGFDPREFTLFSFGGAGGMHCTELARLLGMPTVFIPVNPGILSATGMLMADVVKDYSRTIMCGADDFTPDAMEHAFAQLEARGEAELSAEGLIQSDITHERYLDMRYTGQSFEIVVPFCDAPIEAFHTLHEKQYGHRNDKPVEVVNVRLRSLGRQPSLTFSRATPGPRNLSAAAITGKGQTIFSGKEYETAIIDRNALAPGNNFTGPAIVTEYSSTIVIPPQVTVQVDEWSNLILDIH